MYSPIQHAATTLLQRDQGVTLEGWLSLHDGLTAQALLAQLAIDTGGVIIVDKRTVMRWRNDARISVSA